MRDKVNREEIKRLVYEGFKDHEIGEKLNRATSTIREIRQDELKIKTRGQFFYMEDFRRMWWRRDKRCRGGTSGAMIGLPLALTRKLFTDFEIVKYRMTYELPNKIIIEFYKDKS